MNTTVANLESQSYANQPSAADMFQALSAPFPSTDIEWRVQQAGVKNGRPWAMVLAYVTNRAIQHRLDEVCGPMGWRNEYREENGGVMCGISIWCSDRKEWVTKWDGAEKTDVESFKGGLSASMKRAAVQWGIGRYLYKLESGFAQCFTDKQGKNRGQAIDKQTRQKTYFTWNAPILPAWALPESEVQQNYQPHQIHQPQQQVADQQPAPQGQQFDRAAYLASKEKKNWNTTRAISPEQQARQQPAAKEVLNEAQQAADVLVARHIESANAESAKAEKRRQELQKAADEKQEKINAMAGCKVITPAQVQQLRNVLKQARWNDQSFCQKAGINVLGMLPADRFDGAITWLQKVAANEHERRLRAS